MNNLSFSTTIIRNNYEKNYIVLFIIFTLITSCSNKVTAPSESNGIIYYDPETTETKDFPFFKMDNASGKQIAVKSTFKKLAESKNTIIYIENRYTITRYQLNNFLTQFEKAFEKEMYIYGTPSDIDRNGKIIFLMANLNTNGNNIGGYFSQYDLLYGKGGVKGEYLHVNIEWEFNEIFGVMMHELQHLINYNVNVFENNKAMDIWLNEGLSESTSHAFNIEDTIKMRSKEFIVPYYSFYSWYFQYEDRKNIFPKVNSTYNYSPVSIFMKWLDTKTGGNQEIYKRIASSSIKDSEQILLDSVKALNPDLGSDMDTLLINWIKGINNGDIKDITDAPKISDLASASDKAYKEFIKDGKTQLLPRALIVCSQQDADKITDPNIRKEALGNGNYIVLNTRKNTIAGYTSASDIIPISLTRTAARNNNVTELTMFKKDYFTDIVITK